MMPEPPTLPSTPFSQTLCFYLIAGFTFVALLAALKSVFNSAHYGFACAYIALCCLAAHFLKSRLSANNYSRLAVIMIGYFSVAYMQGFNPKVTLVVFVISMGYLLLEILTRCYKDT